MSPEEPAMTPLSVGADTGKKSWSDVPKNVLADSADSIALRQAMLQEMLLPMPRGSGFIVEQERYLKKQAEAVLKGLVEELRAGTLDFQKVALGIGRITGYYDLMGELHRQQRQLEEQHS